jgi:hypothetical protein
VCEGVTNPSPDFSIELLTLDAFRFCHFAVMSRFNGMFLVFRSNDHSP